ncbi:sensor histidine kinase [Chitinophaga sp. RAB17]|uniref:sensor histidine kinase n=1 Tax=Chitinophaga sp. RAB17 TaxID=3233049 RepID=UPI003F8DE739
MSTPSYSKSTRYWLFRYKLHHIPFWVAYNYLWWTVAIGNPVKAASAMFFSPFTIKFLFYLIFQAAAVYFNLYVLIPKYLEKGRFTVYIISLIITILCATCLIIPGYYFSAMAAGQTMTELYGKETAGCIYQFFGTALPSTLAVMTLAMSITLTRNWLQTQRRQQLLEKEKLETELNFLKYQFNPHFLFNSINSIFFLIHKNPDMASASLAKFSDLLRYQLYDCNDKQIPLSNEISYLENFIELEKLRQNNNMEVTVQMNQQHTGHLLIAPFILMTFVENAFKHVSKHTDAPNWIHINMQLDQQQLDMTISNSTAPDMGDEVVHYGGIGLKNVQRRLDLIYSGQYELDIDRDENMFTVRFKLNLTPLKQAPANQQLALTYK